MLMLAFDKVIMNSERGFCFVPGCDLGIVYSPGMTALMVAKLPAGELRTDFIVFGKRYGAPELERHGVVKAVPAASVMDEAMKVAENLKKKSAGGVLGRIKEVMYHEACAALECELDDTIFNPHFVNMGFGKMDPTVDKPVAAAPPALKASDVGRDFKTASTDAVTTEPGTTVAVTAGTAEANHPAATHAYQEQIEQELQVRGAHLQKMIEHRRRSTLITAQIESNATILALAQRLEATSED
jgi:hypothetical protein